MANSTRREFLKAGAAASACLALAGGRARALPYGLPLGLQLYTVREELPQDYQGTLEKVAALGYRDVEAAGFYGHSAADVKAAMAKAGLRCVSGHYPSGVLAEKLDSIIDFHRTLGARAIICASPGHKSAPAPGSEHSFSLEDWRWNAENFNRWGARVKAAGLQFGYHNHTPEFVVVDGVLPYDELMRRTRPELVTFEMDCGWVVVGGGDPAQLLQKYPTRISMLHVKDFQPGVNPPHAAQLGHGRIDYTKIFAAARPGAIRHYFVEQEQFDIPWQEALRIDAEYLRSIRS
jgi:sugar phosphate isomerase/epimerase